MTFALTPAPAQVTQGLPGDWLQVRQDGDDRGDADVQVIDIVGDPELIQATRGIGENAHVITVRKIGGAPAAPEIIRMQFDVEPLVESTGNGWTGSSPNPGTFGGAVIARPHVFQFYYTLTTPGLNAGLLLPSLQWTMEYWLSRPGTINPGGASWEVGFDIFFQNAAVTYEAGLYLSAGWIHNDVAHPIPYLTFGANGDIYLFGASPDAPLTLQSDRMTHIAMTFDEGTIKVYCHGVLVGNYPNAIAVDEADTGKAFPPTTVYGALFNLYQFFGDTNPAYMDDVVVTRGVKYPAAFTPPFKALPA